MVAHVGHCEACGQDMVKMGRTARGELVPNWCWCLACGETYFMEIPDLKEWERQQWMQKEEKE